MVRQMIRALGFGAVFGAVALAESAPEKNPIKVLSDEIESAKRFVEPFQGVLHEIGKGFEESAKASTAADAGSAAVLKLESQAVASVRQAAEPEPAEVPAAAKEEAVASVRQAAEPEPAEVPAAAKEEAAPAATAAPAAAVEPAAAQAQGTMDEKERKKLWALLSFPSSVEIGLLAKFASASYFGPKLLEWCANATSEAGCKFENGMKQYRQLIRRAAPSLMDAVAFSTIAQGILDGEPMPPIGRAQKQAPVQAPAPAAASVPLSAQRAAPSDDTALWHDLTGSEPFQKKVAYMCSSLERAHPGCKEVAKEIAYCDALAKAALTLFSYDELSTKLVDAFLKTPHN